MSKVRQIQLGELSLLEKYIEVCSKYNLRYYALGGTLLGAIRHKGFIPWDDRYFWKGTVILNFIGV